MTELEQRLARALREDVPVPPRRLDPEAIRARAHRRTAGRPRVVLAVLGAAAAVLLAVGIPVGIHLAGSPAAGPSSPLPSLSPSCPPSGCPDPATPAGYTALLLSEVPVPADARRVATAPAGLPTSAPKDADAAATAIAWWTSRHGAVGAGIDLDTVTLPTHWKRIGDVYYDQGRYPSLVTFEIRDPASRYVAKLDVSIPRDGSALAAAVSTYILPVRTSQQMIPAGGSVTVTVTRGSDDDPRNVRLGRSAGASLVRQINSVHTDVDLGIYSCAGGPTGGAVNATFQLGALTWKLAVPSGSSECDPPVLTDPSGHQLQLGDRTAVLHDVLAAAGLPSDYFG